MITKQDPISWFQKVHLFCINKLAVEKNFLKTIYFILGSKVVKSEIIPRPGQSRSSEITLKTLKATLIFEGGCCIFSQLQMLHLFPYIYLQSFFPRLVKHQPQYHLREMTACVNYICLKKVLSSTSLFFFFLFPLPLSISAPLFFYSSFENKIQILILLFFFFLL